MSQFEALIRGSEEEREGGGAKRWRVRSRWNRENWRMDDEDLLRIVMKRIGRTTDMESNEICTENNRQGKGGETEGRYLYF